MPLLHAVAQLLSMSKSVSNQLGSPSLRWEQVFIEKDDDLILLLCYLFCTFFL